MTVARFPFSVDPRYRRASKPFGVRPDEAVVLVGDGRLDARFGRWRLQTPLPNVADVEVTGPFRFLKTAGPPRLGITDLGLTFATNGERGVLITFREKVKAIDPTGLVKHPELTVTVDDVDGLAALLRDETAT